jgi:hypothetical protein
MVWGRYLKDEDGSTDALDDTLALVVGGRRSFTLNYSGEPAAPQPKVRINPRRNSKRHEHKQIMSASEFSRRQQLQKEKQNATT